MKQDLIVRILLLVVLLLGVAVVSHGITARLWTMDGVAVTLQRGGEWAGLDRFMAHVNWMRLLQFRAAVSQRDPSPEIAEALYRRYRRIADLDPHMELAYHHGGLELATLGAPQKALELIDHGLEALDGAQWQLPYYAAHIASQRLEDDHRAESYLLVASKVPDHPFTIETSLVRIRGAREGDDPVKVARLWQQFYGSDHTMGQYGMDAGQTGDERTTKVRQKVADLLREVRREADAPGIEDEQRKALLDKAVRIDQIVQSLRATDPARSVDLKVHASLSLAKLAPGAPEPLAVLSEALGQKGGDGRLSIAVALLEIEPEGETGEEALRVVIEALNSPGPRDRELAARTLGELGERAGPSVPALLAALRDEDVAVAAAAAEALGQVGVDSEEVLQALRHIVLLKPRPLESEEGPLVAGPGSGTAKPSSKPEASK